MEQDGPATFRPRARVATTYTPSIEKGRPVLQGLLAIDYMTKAPRAPKSGKLEPLPAARRAAFLAHRAPARSWRAGVSAWHVARLPLARRAPTRI
ncbi:hypothetical protein TSUD_320030 [Trifolium subterraneum]|uniref:Uncharacterized protein n=1 Tax=Trifolium subterraneum TaxID=3900 RepID=A0A2Z6N482_TRISU|nr:hypothetical protein TSUD_320030 [Trifolium subterraneum]